MALSVWRRNYSAVRLLAVFCLIQSVVFAGTIFTDEVLFQAGLLPSFYEESFDGVTTGPIGPPDTLFSANGYSYNVTAPGDLVWNFDPGSGDRILSTSATLADLVFTFTSGNINAVGGYFWDSDIVGTPVPGSATITLSDGTVETLVNPTASTYFGYISDGAPLASMAVGPSSMWIVVNDVTVGQSAIPEPGTWTLVLGGLGLLAIGCLRRRRQ